MQLSLLFQIPNSGLLGSHYHLLCEWCLGWYWAVLILLKKKSWGWLSGDNSNKLTEFLERKIYQFGVSNRDMEDNEFNASDPWWVRITQTSYQLFPNFRRKRKISVCSSKTWTKSQLVLQWPFFGGWRFSSASWMPAIAVEVDSASCRHNRSSQFLKPFNSTSRGKQFVSLLLRFGSKTRKVQRRACCLSAIFLKEINRIQCETSVFFFFFMQTGNVISPSGAFETLASRLMVLWPKIMWCYCQIGVLKK